MAEQMRRDIRRAAERDAGEERQAALHVTMSNTRVYAHTAFRNTEMTMYRFSAWITDSPPAQWPRGIPEARCADD